MSARIWKKDKGIEKKKEKFLEVSVGNDEGISYLQARNATKGWSLGSAGQNGPEASPQEDDFLRDSPQKWPVIGN